MKHLFYLFLLLAGTVFALSSCSNDEDLTNNSLTNMEIPYSIKSNITHAQMQEMKETLNKYFGINVRAGAIDVNEDTLAKIFKPFVEDGENIRQQLLEIPDSLILKNPILAIESEDPNIDIIINGYDKSLEDMTQQELAALSIIVNADKIVPGTSPNNVSKDKVYDCIKAGLGLKSIKLIISGTSELMTVTTALQIAKVVGKRFLGWVGLAIFVVDFADCIS